MKRHSRNKLYSFPIPRNDEEFALLSLWYFGKALTLESLDCWSFKDGVASISYAVADKYNTYHGAGFAYGPHACDGYDSSAHFLAQIFGTIHCGGIASSAYGQSHLRGHRNHARIMAWIESRRQRRVSCARKSFVRLAADVGGGERARIRGVRSLSLGRVDGVKAVPNRASFATGASES